MFLVSLLWLALGAVLGLIVVAARLGFVGINDPSWFASRAAPLTVGLGAVAAFVGGWLGVASFGRYSGTPMALWFGIAIAALGPRGWLLVSRRMSR